MTRWPERTALDTFPLIEVRGSPRERGHAHGETCRERIVATFALYMDALFAESPLDRAAIVDRAATIEQLARRYAPAIAEEIDGIAAGSDCPPWQIYLLNGRTEIINAAVDECTSLCFTDTRLLAQNWDWIEPLEALAVIIRHQREDGGTHVTFCEPGMVAKIGMNDRGLGVCLNILFAPHDLSGLPVHMLIGAVLQCGDFAAAHALLDGCGAGKASHLLVADAAGNAVSMEYFGAARYALEAVDGVLLHTNHCLGLGAAGREGDLANSCARIDRIDGQVRQSVGRDMAAARALLFDTSGEHPIQRHYHPSLLLGGHEVGSCACIIMELEARRMHVRRGPGTDDRFQVIAL